MNRIIAILILFISLCFLCREDIRMRKEVINLQMDRDEIKLHTDMLAQIVKTQQYQLDVLTESIK